MTRNFGLKQWGMVVLLIIMVGHSFGRSLSLAETAPAGGDQAAAQLPMEQVQQPSSTQAASTDKEEAAPTQVVEAAPTQVVEAAPTQVVEAAPTQVVEAIPTQVVEAIPTQVVEAAPTQVVEAIPTQGVEAAPTQGVEAAPTQGVEAIPTQVVEAIPTQVVEAAPTQVVEAIPTQGATLVPAQMAQEASQSSQYAWIEANTKIYQRPDTSAESLYCTTDAAAIVFVLEQRDGWAKCAFAEAYADKIGYGYVKVSQLEYLSRIDEFSLLEKAKASSAYKILGGNIYLLPVEVIYSDAKEDIEPELEAAGGVEPEPELEAVGEPEPELEAAGEPEPELEAAGEMEPEPEPEAAGEMEPEPEATGEMEPEAVVTPEEDTLAQGEPSRTEELQWAERLDETHPNRSIQIVADWGDCPIALGVEVTLIAHISGYDGLETQIFWQVNRGGEWETVDESGSPRYAFTLNEENSQWQWRAGVNVLLAE